MATNGDLHEGEAVCEVTELMDLQAFPLAARCIVRHEPLHQGAQRSLLPTLRIRIVALYADLDGDLSSSTSRGVPTPTWSNPANATWLLAVTLAADLVRWFQLVCLDGTRGTTRDRRRFAGSFSTR